MSGTYSATSLLVRNGQTVTVVIDNGNAIATSTVLPEQEGSVLTNVYVPGITKENSVPGPSPSSASELSSTIADDSTTATDSISTGFSNGATQSTSTEMDSSSSSSVWPTAEVTEPSSPGRGIQGGAVAGVVIGCLIAGLALGLVVAFILFRRRRNNSTSPDFIAVEPQYAEPKHGPQVSVTPSGHDAELSQFLLDATPDKEIQAELSSLSELIYQHVETYYHGPQVQATSAEVAQSLVNIGYSPELSGTQPEAVAAICLDSKTSQVGLRHVLSHVIFRGLDFNSGGNLSMLPLVVAVMARENHPESTDSPAIALARSRWRSLSALLLHPNPTERTPLPVSTDEAPSKAYSLANKLNTLLQIFVAQDHASRQDQTSHLQAVILECTKLGHVLLSQPGDWGFVFSNKPTVMDRVHMIVVCPGLERLSHNDGTRYRSAKEVAAPETMPL
ncbi:hypothetical protein NW768_003573 [Fusarium equiseti]|uniref:Uncharacterized protein n=1 Tax=Fusarium equiseti TaxID=61235 RepID=A0ABQ8RI09_FUSEQ|nr:hypothetical protein NW768_003573 [Fusarium equiseti]